MMMMICSVILCVFEGIRPQFDVSAVLGINAGVGPRLTKYWSWFGAIQVYQCGTLEKKRNWLQKAERLYQAEHLPNHNE